MEAFNLKDFAILVDSTLNKDEGSKLLLLELFDFFIRDYPNTAIGGDNFQQKVNAITAQLPEQYVILLVEDLFESLTNNCEGDTFKDLKKNLPSNLPKSIPLSLYFTDSQSRNIEPPPVFIPSPDVSHYITDDLGENEILSDPFILKLRDCIPIDDLNFFAVYGIGDITLIKLKNLKASNNNSDELILAVLQLWRTAAGTRGVGEMKPCTKKGLKKALFEGKLNYIIKDLKLMN